MIEDVDFEVGYAYEDSDLVPGVEACKVEGSVELVEHFGNVYPSDRLALEMKDEDS